MLARMMSGEMPRPRPRVSEAGEILLWNAQSKASCCGEYIRARNIDAESPDRSNLLLALV